MTGYPAHQPATDPPPDRLPADRAVLPADRAAADSAALPGDRIALVDLLDRVLAGGVVVAGEVTLSVADVDMVTISLRALVTSISALAGPQPLPAITQPPDTG